MPASTHDYTIAGVVFILALVGTMGGIFGGVFFIKFIRRIDFSRLFTKTITHDGLVVTLEKYDTSSPEAQQEPSVVEVIPPTTTRLHTLLRRVHTAFVAALARVKGLTSPYIIHMVKVKCLFARSSTDLEQAIEHQESWIVMTFKSLFKRREACAPVLESIAVFEGPRTNLRPPTMNMASKGIALKHAHLGMAETVEISSEGRITIFDRFGRTIRPKEVDPAVEGRPSEEESISSMSVEEIEESKEGDVEVEVEEVQDVPSIIVESPSDETIAVEEPLEGLPSEEVQQEESTCVHETIATAVAEEEPLGELPSEEVHQEESDANSEVVLTATPAVELASTSTTPEPSSSVFTNVANVGSRPSTPKSPRSRRSGMYIDDYENDELEVSPRRNRTLVIYKESARQCDAGYLMPPSKGSTGKARPTPPRQVVFVPRPLPSPRKGAPSTPPRRPRRAPILSPLASPQGPRPRQSIHRPVFPSSNFHYENSTIGTEDFRDAFIRSELVSRSLNTHRVLPVTCPSRPSSGSWI